jgi:phosphopantothenoylcysteine decarboxylase/phosphopantothenate--cysteine ligase
MGFAVARAAREAGADVTLVAGPSALATPPGVRRVDVVSADEMLAAVKAHVDNVDVFVSVAAVADYRPVQTSEQKLKKSARNMTIELTPTPDILAYVAGLPNPPFCVGFAAESEKLAEYAEAKRRRKNVPLLAANLAQDAMGADENEITLFDEEGAHPLPKASKEEIARQLVARISQRYRHARVTSSR